MPRPRTFPPGLWKRGDTYYARFRAQGRLVRKKCEEYNSSAPGRVAGQVTIGLRQQLSSVSQRQNREHAAWRFVARQS